jgi:sugar transferase (PEP-CTERM system associated)
VIHLFRHYFPKAFMTLGVSESVIFFVAVYAAAEFLRHRQDIDIEFMGLSLFLLALAFSAVLTLSFTAIGLYQRGLRDRFCGMLVRTMAGFGLGFALLHLGLMAFAVPLANTTINNAMLLSLVGISSVRALFHLISENNRFRQRVMVLGIGRQAAEVSKLRRKADWRGLCLVGYVGLPGQEKVVNSEKVMSITTSLPDLAEQYVVNQLIIAADDRELEPLINDILTCKLRGIEVIDLLTFMERHTAKIQLDALGPFGITFLDGFSHAVIRKRTKRVFDVVVSAAMLFIMLPVMVVTALAILAESRGHGPILYFQNRIGREGRIVRLMKFRSMCTNAEPDNKAVWASAKDGRVTKVGRFIRPTRIDELPQLINVLLGDMSFVGPRPERPEFVDKLSETIPYYGMRHCINPGITGWAQIKYPYGSSEKDAKEKLQYDLYYIKNYSLLLDIIIILETVAVVLWAKGAR